MLIELMPVLAKARFSTLKSSVFLVKERQWMNDDIISFVMYDILPEDVNVWSSCLLKNYVIWAQSSYLSEGLGPEDLLMWEKFRWNLCIWSSSLQVKMKINNLEGFIQLNCAGIHSSSFPPWAAHTDHWEQEVCQMRDEMLITTLHSSLKQI